MEDSSQPPLDDPSHKDQTMEEPPLHDQQPDHKVDDEFVYSSDYSSYESDYTQSDSEALSYESDYTQSDEEFTASSLKQEAKPSTARDIWKKSWPKEGTKTESARVHVFGFYRESTRCGGYAIILRNQFGQPIAARVKVSPDGKSHIYQVLAGLVAGFHLAAEHGCSTPLVQCNSSKAVELILKFVPCVSCQGSICYKCACSFFPDLSVNCFETLVPLLKEFLGEGFLDLESVLRRSNKPAYYLAKQAKEEALKEEALVDGKVVGFDVRKKPDEFPDVLVSILMSDSMYHSIYYK